ncbi:MAG TPA: hypothetical protein VFV92_11605 [Candidatus Bathyarchaeia archaeon]|nr:hypothetical protein [Candidatus Bathyarchaeia archaeon]
MLARSDIIDALVKTLAHVDYVQAFWEGGAAAWNRVDKWSDIDAYLLVDDGKVSETFKIVETVLTTLSPIKQKYLVTRSPWPGVSQAFYSLELASEYLVLDLAILTSSSSTKFLEPAIHGKSIFYVNKLGIDQEPTVDLKAFQKKSEEDMDALKQRFQMFSNFVEKEIKRENSLEALEYYRTIIVPSLVQALRAKHTPMHYDFRMRYIQYELPVEIVKKLENLCFVSGLRDLETKNSEAIRWFNELTGKLSVQRKISGSE